MKNPLIQKEGLPAFENINASHVEPAIDKLLLENRSIVQSLLSNTKIYNWDNLLQKLEDMSQVHQNLMQLLIKLLQTQI